MITSSTDPIPSEIATPTLEEEEERSISENSSRFYHHEDGNNNTMASHSCWLTPCEMSFLDAFVIDPFLATASPGDKTSLIAEIDNKVLNDKASYYPSLIETDDGESDCEAGMAANKSIKKPFQTKSPQEYRTLVGIWQAFEDGVTPKRLLNVSSKQLLMNSAATKNRSKFYDGSCTNNATFHSSHIEDAGYDWEANKKCEGSSVNVEELSIRSDAEVRRNKVNHDTSDTKITDDDCDTSDGSSWAEENGGFEHFDAWQVLKDEYSNDFGFDYSDDGEYPRMDDSEIEQHHFRILGTSADDISAHPHVLSPPLMDALLTFVPESLSCENFWLKYSLVRDGACIDTFKNYARGSKYTILAIETTKGHVFGCFTSSPWHTSPGFYGGDPAFLWRMRYNRNSSCHCLFEQAQLEAEIDVHFLIGNDQYVQSSTHDRIGVGEGVIEVSSNDDENDQFSSRPAENLDNGFAIAIEKDLLSGTTSQCGSFCNPCLTNPTVKSEAFEVVNVELWTFTPCYDVDSAEKLEMSQYFISQSLNNNKISTTTTPNNDMNQFEFYRRAGQNEA